jgi:hypothetical protein
MCAVLIYSCDLNSSATVIKNLKIMHPGSYLQPCTCNTPLLVALFYRRNFFYHMEDSTTSTTCHMVHCKHQAKNGTDCIFATSELTSKLNSSERLRRTSCAVPEENLLVRKLLSLEILEDSRRFNHREYNLPYARSCSTQNSDLPPLSATTS